MARIAGMLFGQPCVPFILSEPLLSSYSPLTGGFSIIINYGACYSKSACNLLFLNFIDRF